ncbi:MAG: RNA polymerase sigma-70 factor [Bacteroidales bacterium]|nr:RNA polymerase sigma-70 factor [Bacteroidales bacterium]MBN2763739.1 RNA polymerase sigma-70 factor [Bacteroidales bacterium]
MTRRKKPVDLDDLKSGDIYPYEMLFREYYRPLVVFALKYVKDQDTAKEIVQEFFVKLYEKRFSFVIDTSLKSYLYRSIYNSCINYISHIEMRNRHFKKIALLTENDFSENQISTIELQNRIYTSIDSLPLQCKRIFKMNRLEGLKNEEIAEKLKISKRTVETQISKALKIMRKKLADYLPFIIVTNLLII